MPDDLAVGWHVAPTRPLPSARQSLLVARLLARHPPLCAAVGSACQRVLLQTLCDWSGTAPGAHVVSATCVGKRRSNRTG
jgi:hypothetical protein